MFPPWTQPRICRPPNPSSSPLAFWCLEDLCLHSCHSHWTAERCSLQCFWTPQSLILCLLDYSMTSSLFSSFFFLFSVCSAPPVMVALLWWLLTNILSLTRLELHPVWRVVTSMLNWSCCSWLSLLGPNSCNRPHFLALCDLPSLDPLYTSDTLVHYGTQCSWSHH